jgi:predicted HAD superfamily phosphohydrolase YqeG
MGKRSHIIKVPIISNNKKIRLMFLASTLDIIWKITFPGISAMARVHHQ